MYNKIFRCNNLILPTHLRNNFVTQRIFHGENKPWLVLIHGLFDSYEGFASLISLFKKKFNLLLMTLPGHGNDKLRDPISLHRTSFLLAEQISMHCKSCHIIGFSMGGRIACLVAKKLKRIVKSIILLDIGLGPRANGSKLLTKLHEEIDLIPIISDGQRNILIKKYSFLSEKSFVSISGGWRWNVNFKMAIRWVKAVEKLNTWPFWTSLKCHRLSICSTSSGYVYSTDFSRFKIYGKVESLEGGHALHKAQPKQVAKYIIDFVRRV